MPNRSDEPTVDDARGPSSELRARASVKTLLARFPHVRALSLELLERREEFREMCDEYEACVEVIERLSQSKAQSDEPMYREYSALCLRLEGELLRYLACQRGADGSGTSP